MIKVPQKRAQPLSRSRVSAPVLPSRNPKKGEARRVTCKTNHVCSLNEEAVIFLGRSGHLISLPRFPPRGHTVLLYAAYAPVEILPNGECFRDGGVLYELLPGQTYGFHFEDGAWHTGLATPLVLPPSENAPCP